MGKENILLFVAVFIVFTLFLISDNGVASVTGNPVFDTMAVAATASINISVRCDFFNYIPNTYGNLSFTGSCGKNMVQFVTGLSQNWSVNLTLFGKHFPVNWAMPQPNSTEAGEKKFRYFEFSVNNATENGDYKIYFNLSNAELNGTAANKIKMYVYNESSSWKKLITNVIYSDSVYSAFYAMMSHFSNFLIAEDSDSSDSSGSSSSNGDGVTVQKSSSKSIDSSSEKQSKPTHEKGDLFDVAVNIPIKYRKLLRGDNIIGEITLLNIKRIGAVDVRIDYEIKSSDGNLLYEESETRGVEASTSFIKRIKIDDGFQIGKYSFFVRVNYQGDIATASYPFEIIESSEESGASALSQEVSKIQARQKKIIIAQVFIMLLPFLALPLYIYYERKKLKRMELLVSRVSEKDLSKKGMIRA